MTHRITVSVPLRARGERATSLRYEQLDHPRNTTKHWCKDRLHGQLAHLVVRGAVDVSAKCGQRELNLRACELRHVAEFHSGTAP